MLLVTFVSLAAELLPLLLLALDMELPLVLTLELEVEAILVMVLLAATKLREVLELERLLDDVVPAVRFVLRRSHDVSTVLEHTEDGMVPDSR